MNLFPTCFIFNKIEKADFFFNKRSKILRAKENITK